jgi:HK97 family phage major capsid protein
MTIKEMQEKRVKAHADAMALVNNDAMTTETRAKFDAFMAEVDQLGADIRRIEAADKAEAELRKVDRPAQTAVNTPGDKKSKEEIRADWNKAMKEVACKGVEASREARALVTGNAAEYRDGLTVGTLGAGGYLVPQGFVYEVDEATKFISELYANADVMDTATGNDLPWPSDNDTSNAAYIVGEAAGPVNEIDDVFSHVTFKAWKYSTGLVKVSLELLQDSAFDLPAFLAKKFAVRNARGLNPDFTSGAGSAGPQGLVYAASNGPTVVGSNNNDGITGNNAHNSIGSDDLIALEHSVDRSYRNGAKWMMHDSTLKSLKNLKDKYGRPLWLPGLGVNAGDTILGYRYIVNNDMDAMTTGTESPTATKNPIAFGAISDKFVVRRVRDLFTIRLDERYAEYGQVAFIGFSRFDSRLLDAGTHPVKKLVMVSA